MTLSIEQIVIQLGIGAFSMYLFYRYAMYIAKKSMNGITEKVDKLLIKQEKLMNKIDILINRLEEICRNKE